MELTEEQWRIIAKALTFVRDFCTEQRAEDIIRLIGENGEQAAREGTTPSTR